MHFFIKVVNRACKPDVVCNYLFLSILDSDFFQWRRSDQNSGTTVHTSYCTSLDNIVWKF